MIAAKSPSTRQKHEIVREYLTESLRSGEFEVGRRLPADKDLAARLGVSYMTARKAVNELVEASFLERRIGDGTYVRAGTQQRLLTTTLNLICTAYEGATTRAFLQLGGVAAQKRGWRSHVIRIHSASGRQNLFVFGRSQSQTARRSSGWPDEDRSQYPFRAARCARRIV